MAEQDALQEEKQRLLYPTKERTYEIIGNQIPPENYSTFLSETVSEFTKMVLQYNEAKDLDEVVEKHKEGLRAANPNHSEKDLFEDDEPVAVSINFRGRLRYFKRDAEERVPNEVYQSQEYEEDLFDVDGEIISLENYTEELDKIIGVLRTELDRRYADRQGGLLINMPGAERDEDIHQKLNEFKFTLHLQSDPTGLLETEITLRDYGCISSSPGELFKMIPGINVKAEVLSGQLDLPEKVINSMEKLVHKFYKVRRIEKREGYVEEYK